MPDYDVAEGPVADRPNDPALPTVNSEEILASLVESSGSAAQDQTVSAQLAAEAFP